MEGNLPEGWVETLLGIIADWRSGGTPKSTEPKFYDGHIPWLIIGDLNDGEITTSQKKITQSGLESCSTNIVPNDSILCAMYGSIGKLGIAKIPCATNQAIAYTQKIYADIPPKFLYYTLYSLKKHLLNLGKGGTQANISLSILKEVSFPLPPLPEQRRIVAKLDALFEKIESNKKRLEQIPKLLKRFRQSVLAAAVSGRLTEEWRKERKLQEWIHVELGNIIPKGGIFDGPFGSNLKTSDYTDEGVRVIRLENIEHLNFINEKETYIPEDKFQTLKRHEVGEGDILFSSFISEEIRACILPSLSTKAIAKADCFCIRPDEKLINKTFLLYILVSFQSFEQLVLNIHGATRPRINTTQLKNLLIQLPESSEQTEIVRRVEQLFALADTLEARYAKAKALLDKLPQSLLAKAFRGELVPQDPADEPAAVLLGRIRAMSK